MSISVTYSMRRAPQDVQAVNLELVLGEKTILLKSILMELIASPVFLSASIFKKLDVGISITQFYYRSSINCNIIEHSMRTTNKVNQCQIRCGNCSSSLLDRIGSEIYCLSCQTVNNVLQFETQVVPAAYESNSRNRRQLDMERKLNAHLREFINKYNNHCQDEEIKLYREKLMRIKSMTPNSKGTRQAAAVVVYCSLKSEIKLSIIQFCKQNNIKHRMFNQKYKVYHQLYNNVQHISSAVQLEKEQNHFIKAEERADHFSIASKSEQSISQGQQENDKIMQISLSQSSKGIEIVFDDIFPNFYLKQQKQHIIQKLITKIGSIPRQFFTLIQSQPLSKPVQLYYLIFAIIKTLGYKINFQKYNEIIKNKTGYTLKKSFAFEVKKHYDHLYKKEKQVQSQSIELIQVNGIKIQDNNSEVLRIRFPLADSQNQFQYQYYFDNQF